MAVKPLDKYDYWIATIDWKAPHKWYRKDKFYSAGVDLDDKLKNEYGIYRFERRFQKLSKGKEIIYIGIAYCQPFDARLHCGDHAHKIEQYKKPGEIWVSVGTIDLPDTIHRREQYEDIEGVLIYFTKPFLNKQKMKWINSDPFVIMNRGYRGLLPEYIKFPVAEIK
jgi:hypothetical protein